MSASFESWAGAFRAAGGSHCFGIPGGGDSLKLGDAILRVGGRFVVTGHEMTAALMAGGYSSLSGRPAICTSIKGPGFANLLPGLICNAYEGIPMLALCESYPESTTRRHKWLDHGALMAGFSRPRFVFEDCADCFEKAWAAARQEQPGPVLIDLGGSAELKPSASQRCPEMVASKINDIFSRIRSAARPAIIVGSAASRAGLREALSAVRCPLFTTPSAKGLVDETSPWAAGIFTGAGTEKTIERDVLPRADLLLAIAVRQGEILGEIRHAHLLRVEIGQHENLFPPEPEQPDLLPLSSEEIREIINELGGRSWGEEFITSARSALVDAVAAEGWTPGSIARIFAGRRDHFAHFLDTGNFTVLAEHLLLARPSNRVLGTPNGRWMGAAAGLALGGAFACQNGEAAQEGVVLWIGDGGIRSLGLELRLAVEHRLPLLVLLMEDGYLGSVRGRVSDERLREGPLAMGGPSVSLALESLGFAMADAADETSFDAALRSWRESPAPTCIRCRFNSAAYERAGNLLR